MIDQGSAAQHLHSHLKRIAGASTKDSGIEIEVVSRADVGPDGLSEGVALRIPTGAEAG